MSHVLRRPTRSTCLGVLGLGLIASTGCYGRFPLTKAIYRFNGEAFDSGILQTLLFWVFLIIPVYWIAMVGDAIIFNLIEFWTGTTLDLTVESPMSDGGTVRLIPGETADSITVEVEHDGRIERQRHVRHPDGTVEILGEDGVTQARLLPAGDGFDVFGPDGAQRAHVPLSELRRSPAVNVRASTESTVPVIPSAH